MKTSLLLMVLMVVMGGSMAQNPGAKIRVTKNGLDYADRVATVAIGKVLREVNLNDMEGKDGKYSYWLKNIRTNNIVGPDISITLDPGQRGLTCAVTNFGITMSADYRVKTKVLFVPISNSGGITASVGGASMTVTIGIDQFEDTSPKLISRNCNANIGDFNIRFHGSLAWLLNLLKGLFRGKIRDMLKNKICENVVKAINTNAADKLRQMRLEADIAGKFNIDYKLVSPVQFTGDYLEILNKGVVRWKTDSQTAIPFSADPIPAWNDNSNMLYLWLSEYTPRTLLYAAHTHNYLEFELSPDKLPEHQKVYLNTTCPDAACAGTLIPKLGQNYPNSMITVKVVSREVPEVRITSQGLSLSLFGNVELSTTTAASIISANLTVTLVGTANVRDDRIVGHITNFSTVIESIKSTVGDIDLVELNRGLTEGMEMLVMPQINAFCDVGLPLPMIPELALQRSRIIYQEKAVLIGTDVQYQGIP